MPLSLPSFSIASSRQQRWLRLAVGALAALIVIWLVSWLAIAHLAKGPLERIASEQLGRPVTVGARKDGVAEITNGLSGGETVVTYGAYGVEDGAKIVPKKPS